MSRLIEQLYEQYVQPLSPDDQLLLMERIARGIAATNNAEAIAWAEQNKRRGELIYKRVFASLSDVEQVELARLQREADERLRSVAPRPLDALDRLERTLSQKQAATLPDARRANCPKHIDDSPQLTYESCPKISPNTGPSRRA